MGGIRCRASGQLIAKPISIKGTGCKSGGCAPKAVKLTSGDLPLVRDTGLRVERLILTGRQKSAADEVVRQRTKVQTVLRKGVMGAASKERDSRVTGGRKTS
jgi:hypothetical protein